jgi:aspartate/methionine/tyrosine aminotransferase
MRNSRRGEVDPFIVMDVLEAARRHEAAGRHIVHMEIGQPGTGAPKAALDLLAADMAAGPLGYTVALGLPELRARIARLYADWHGLEVSPDRIVVTAGASGAFILAFSALFETGARVGLGEPCYPSYRQILRALDMVPVGIPTEFANRFQPRPEDIAAHALHGLIVASPANPSGTMLTKAELAALAAACAAEGAAFVSDEIYHGVGSTKATTALAVTDDVYVINSFSKYFSMTGWRVGWMVVPPDHVRRIERLAQNLFICPSNASQRLAYHAMGCEGDLRVYADSYEENRRLMLAGLPEAGFTRFAPPDGAFYIYADVSEFTDNSLAFSTELLDGAGVAVTPGLDFDPVRGGQWMRFSYAGATAEIAEGLRRLTAYMAKRGAK